MAPFRWPKVEQDIALCKEIIERRPVKPDDWEDIGASLSNLFSAELDNPVHLKGRGCRERSELLLRKYKSEERKALKRSGTEEEYDELQRLLADITTYVADMSSTYASPSKKEKKKDEEDRKKGLDMRKAAMETYAKNKKIVQADSDDEIDGQEEIAPECSKKSTKRRTGSSQMLNYLTEKHENNMKVKERKLDLEERKLQLEEKKIAIEQMKWKIMMSSHHAFTEDDFKFD